MKYPVLLHDQFTTKTNFGSNESCCLIGWTIKEFSRERFDFLNIKKFRLLLAKNIKILIKKSVLQYTKIIEEEDRTSGKKFTRSILVNVAFEDTGSYISIANDYFLTPGQRAAVWNKTAKEFMGEK